MDTIPQAQLILGYTEFFNVAPPENRLDILAGFCKRHLLGELAGLNYRLKPKNTIYENTSLKKQGEELRYFCKISNRLLDTYSKVAQAHTAGPHHYPLIFIRQFCLFAMEEIIQLFYGENTIRDVLGVKSHHFSGGVTYDYGPSRYDPVLPGTRSRYETIRLKNDLNKWNQELFWTIYADNAEVKTGSINLSELVKTMTIL